MGLIANDNNDFKLQFDGKFELWENNYQIQKNLKYGFFIEGRVPIRKVKIKNISYTDLTTGVQAENADWIQFKNNFDNTLGEFGYKPHNLEFCKSGLGDVSILLGWENIYKWRDNKYNQ